LPVVFFSLASRLDVTEQFLGVTAARYLIPPLVLWWNYLQG